MPKGSGATSNRSPPTPASSWDRCPSRRSNTSTAFRRPSPSSKKRRPTRRGPPIGTVTEIYDYLRILYARLGKLYCPECQIPVETQTSDQIVDKILALPAASKLILLAPQEVAVGQSYDTLWQRVQLQGFLRVRIDGKIYRLEDVPQIDRRRKHAVEIVVDRIAVDPKARSRIAGSVETALDLGRGAIFVARVDDSTPEDEWIVDRYSLHFACHQCGRSFEELTPNSFSFNSPLGWCPACEGLGTEQGTNLAALIADAKRTLQGRGHRGLAEPGQEHALWPHARGLGEAGQGAARRAVRASGAGPAAARPAGHGRSLDHVRQKGRNGSSSTRDSFPRSKRRPAFRTVTGNDCTSWSEKSRVPGAAAAACVPTPPTCGSSTERSISSRHCR